MVTDNRKKIVLFTILSLALGVQGCGKQGGASDKNLALPMTEEPSTRSSDAKPSGITVTSTGNTIEEPTSEPQKAGSSTSSVDAGASSSEVPAESVETKTPSEAPIDTPQKASPTKPLKHSSSHETRDIMNVPRHALIGLTKAQLKARFGAPQKKVQGRWRYIPKQSGCRDVIMSLDVQFKKGKVVDTKRARERTHKHCSRPKIKPW